MSKQEIRTLDAVLSYIAFPPNTFFGEHVDELGAGCRLLDLDGVHSTTNNIQKIIIWSKR